jgi:hypothetical protein
MFYRLLGMAVWKGGRIYIRRRYGGRPPARVFAALGGALALAVAAAVFATRNGNDSE